MLRRISFVLVISLAGLALLVPGVAAGGGCYPDRATEMSVATTRHLTISECAFKGTVAYIEPGETVTWINEDEAPHTVSGAAYSWGTEDSLGQGDTVSQTFKQQGVFPYYCAFHPTMVGAIVVGDPTAFLQKDAGLPLFTGGASGDDPNTKALAPVTASDSGPTAASGGFPTSLWLALASLSFVGLAWLAFRRPRFPRFSRRSRAIG